MESEVTTMTGKTVSDTTGDVVRTSDSGSRNYPDGKKVLWGVVYDESENKYRFEFTRNSFNERSLGRYLCVVADADLAEFIVRAINLRGLGWLCAHRFGVQFTLLGRGVE